MKINMGPVVSAGEEMFASQYFSLGQGSINIFCKLIMIIHNYYISGDKKFYVII
jgi:hypothetical protein